VEEGGGLRKWTTKGKPVGSNLETGLLKLKGKVCILSRAVLGIRERLFLAASLG